MARAEFSLIAITLLFLEILSPFSFAAPVNEAKTTQASEPAESLSMHATDGASPSAPSFSLPSQPRKASLAGSCSDIHELSADQAALFIDRASRMRINDRSNLDAMQAIAQQQQNAQAQSPLTNPGQTAAPVTMYGPQRPEAVPLASVASFAGIDENQAARELSRVNVDGTIDTTSPVPYNQASWLINRHVPNPSQAGSLLEQLFPATQGPPSPTVPPQANYKITFPGVAGNFKMESITDLLSQQPLADKCFLNNQVINGRVSYYGLLNYNIAYGFGDSVKTQEYLNPATGVVDPDFVLSPSAVKQYLESRGTVLAGVMMAENAGNVIIPSFYEYWANEVAAWNRADLIISVGVSAAAQIGGKLAKTQLDTNIQRLDKVRESHASTKRGIGGVTQKLDPISGLPIEGTPDDIITSLRTELGEGQRDMAAIDAQIRSSRAVNSMFSTLGERALNRITFNLVFGMLWLGPMRLAYEMAEGQLMEGVYDPNAPNADKFLLLMVNRNVASQFRKSTSAFNIVESIQKLTGAFNADILRPDEIWSVGGMRIINLPTSNAQTDKSTTTVSADGSGWSVESNWEDAGGSFVSNFEDASYLQRGSGQVTTIPVAVNQMLPAAVIANQKSNAQLLELLGPAVGAFIIAKPMFGYNSVLGFGTAALAHTYLYKTDFSGEDWYRTQCNKTEIDDFLQTFKTAMVVNWVVIAAQTAFSFLFPLSPVLAVMMGVSDPIQYGAMAFQFNAANQGTAYSAECIDQMHKILFYQKLAEPATTAAASGTGGSALITDAVNGVQTTLASLFGSTGTPSAAEQEAERLKNMPEFLSLKVQLTNQVGKVAPAQMYFIHVDDSTSITQENLEGMIKDGCFERLLAGENGAIGLSAGGITAYDENGNVVFSWTDLDNQIRSLKSKLDQEGARYFIPNKFFESYPTDCGDATLISVDTSGYATLENVAGCDADNCIAEKIGEIRGTPFNLGVQGNLRSVIGDVSTVRTTTGRAYFDGTRVYFMETTGDTLRAPDAPVPSSTSIAGTWLRVKANGDVFLESVGGASIPRGKLLTITGSNGDIEFDSSGKMTFFLYVLATAMLDQFNVPTQPLGVPEDGFLAEFDFGPGKPGFEDVTDVFGAAASTATDADGDDKPDWKSMENPNVTTWVGEDANGNPVLYVYDTETGEVKAYPLDPSKSPWRDAEGNIHYPLADGKEIVLKVGRDAEGNLAFGLQTPDKEFDLAALLAGRGQSGTIIFNPQTGAISVNNAFDIPMDPDFASKGMSVMTGNDGAIHSIPANNPFAVSLDDSLIRGKKPSSLVLPSWPENNLLAIAMMALMLVGIVGIRFRERR